MNRINKISFDILESRTYWCAVCFLAGLALGQENYAALALFGSSLAFYLLAKW